EHGAVAHPPLVLALRHHLRCALAQRGGETRLPQIDGQRPEIEVIVARVQRVHRLAPPVATVAHTTNKCVALAIDGRPGRASSGRMADVAGINAASVAQFFREHVPDGDGALQFSLISGGRSNLTYLVRGNGHEWVLR